MAAGFNSDAFAVSWTACDLLEFFILPLASERPNLNFQTIIPRHQFASLIDFVVGELVRVATKRTSSLLYQVAAHLG